MGDHPVNAVPQDKFLRTLATCMHEMAQPLSNIQASSELVLLNPASAEHYREIAEANLCHLNRAVESMQFAARLVLFHQQATDVQETSLRVVLGQVISDLQRTLDAAGIHLILLGSGQDHLIRTSPTRLRQMLFYVLQAVQGCSQPEDVVQIDIQEQDNHQVLRIMHSSGNGDLTDRTEPSHPDIVEKAIALADAIVSSAGGGFSASIAPLSIVAHFPVHHETAISANDNTKLSHVASTHLGSSSQGSFRKTRSTSKAARLTLEKRMFPRSL